MALGNGFGRGRGGKGREGEGRDGFPSHFHLDFFPSLFVRYQRFCFFSFSPVTSHKSDSCDTPVVC